MGHTLAYSGILWHTLAYSGIIWHTVACFGIFLHTLAYSCILWHTLAYSGTSSTHFFRSHRSSSRDFHFLSHYSYIKAIMLYKGWTQCAGFMDASWVRLGITNDDLGTSWALPGQNLARLWHTLAYSGILWLTLAYSGKHWH